MCRASFAVTGLYCGIFWAKKETFDAIGGFVEKKAMEEIVSTYDGVTVSPAPMQLVVWRGPCL